MTDQTDDDIASELTSYRITFGAQWADLDDAIAATHSPHAVAAQRLEAMGNENANLDSACKIADRRNEELQKMLAGAGHALRSYECGNAAPALAKAYADKIEALLSNTESEP